MRNDLMIKNEGDRLEQVIVCTPKQEYLQGANNIAKHNIGILGDPENPTKQHDGLKQTLKKFGVDVIDLNEMKNHPNSVFTRDAALCTPQGFVKLRLGLATREGEDQWMAYALDKLNIDCVGEITAPGTVEGGDIVLAGDVAFIGESVRTNAEGIMQLSVILQPMGFEVRVVKLPDHILHLDKALMTLGANKILYCKTLVKKEILLGFESISIETGGDVTANIICLGDNELIINASNTTVNKLLSKHGFKIHTLNLEEFAKGMGGPNCLIMPTQRGH